MAGRAHPPLPCCHCLYQNRIPHSLFSNLFYTFYCSIELFGILLLSYLVNFIKNIFIINISIFELIILIDCKSLFTKEQKQGLFQ